MRTFNAALRSALMPPMSLRSPARRTTRQQACVAQAFCSRTYRPRLLSALPMAGLDFIELRPLASIPGSIDRIAVDSVGLDARAAPHAHRHHLRDAQLLRQLPGAPVCRAVAWRPGALLQATTCERPVALRTECRLPAAGRRPHRPAPRILHPIRVRRPRRRRRRENARRARRSR
jgi:hypothetical protein